MTIKIDKQEIKEKLNTSHDLTILAMPDCGMEFILGLPKGKLMSEQEKINVIQAIPDCFDRDDNFIDYPKNYNIIKASSNSDGDILIGLDEGLYITTTKDLKFLADAIIQ